MAFNEIVFEESSQDKKLINEQNMRFADENHHLALFICATIGWFKLNPTKNLQDLENYLRDNNFSTHLIATKPKENIHHKLKGYGSRFNENCNWECIFSCRPKEYALKELLEHSATYEENFKKLLDSGLLVVENENSLPDDPSIKKFNDKEKSEFNKVQDNEVIIKTKEITDEQFLSNQLDMIKNKYGKLFVKYQ